MGNIIRKIKCVFGKHPWGPTTLVVKSDGGTLHCHNCNRSKVLY